MVAGGTPPPLSAPRLVLVMDESVSSPRLAKFWGGYKPMARKMQGREGGLGVANGRHSA